MCSMMYNMINSRLLLSLLVFMLVAAKTSGQDTISSVNKKQISDYIGHTDSLLNIKLNGNNNYLWYDVADYDIRPNISLANNVAVAYRLIAFGFSFHLPFIPGNSDDDLKGRTKYFSLGTNYLGKHFQQSLQYSKTRGYYIHNTSDFKPVGWTPTEEDPYFNDPDLKIINWTGISGYKFNPRYSMKAITTQSEIQLKSCGTPLIQLYYNYMISDNKSDDPAQNFSQRGKNLDVQLQAGYLYTFIIKKTGYLSAGVVPGYGFRYNDLLTRRYDEEYKTYFTDPVFRVDFRMGLGYNSYRFFCGLEANVSYSDSDQNNTNVQLNTTRLFSQVFVGYRFRAPGFLSKKEKQLEDQIKIQIEKLK